MADDRKDLPPVTSPNFLEKVRESLSVYLGNRGDVLNRGVTLRDLVDGGFGTLNGRWGANGSGSPLVPTWPPVDPATGPYVIDLTPPPTPTGFAASAAISNIFVKCDAQTYKQGHGHAKSILYGATQVSGPLPTFDYVDEATPSRVRVLTEFQGGVFAYATNPNTTWRLWLKWESVDGVKSVVPAGDTNGVLVITGQDVALLLDALSKKITSSELSVALNTSIDLIEGPADMSGSVAYRVAAEGVDRALALQNYYTKDGADENLAGSEELIYTNMGAAHVFWQATAPNQGSINVTLANGTVMTVPTLSVGDVWYDTSDGNKPNTWNGSAWFYSPNTSVAATTAYIQNLENAFVTPTTATVQSWHDKVAKVDTPEGSLNARLLTDYNAIVSPGGVLATNASYLLASASLGAKTFTGTTAPTQRGTHTEHTVVKGSGGVDVPTDTVVDDALVTGDIWIDTNLIGGVAGNRQKQWTGAAWVYSPDLAIATVDARVANVETTKIGYATKGGVVFDNAGSITTADHVDAWNVAHPSDLATWHVGLPLASAVKQVSVTVNGITGTIEDRMTAVAVTTNSMYLEKAVRIGSGGSVVGYGLSGHVSGGEPVVTDSQFIANVDTFAVTIPVSSTTVWAANTDYALNTLVRHATGYNTQYLQCIQPGRSGSSGTTLWGYAYGVQRTDNTVIWQTVSRVPFSVAKAVTTVDGVAIPTGTFMDGAYIREETVTNSKIHDLKADKITTGTLTAALGIGTGLITSQAVAGKTVSDFSSTWNKTPGFYLDTNKFYIGNGSTQSMTWDGTNFTVKGTVIATAGQIGGNTITSAAVSSPSYSAGSSGWTLKSDGHVEFGAADIRGQLTAGQINTDGLTIWNAGHTAIILNAGASLQSQINPYTSGATVGADGTNLNVGVGKNRIANSGPAMGSKGAYFPYVNTTTGTTTFTFSAGVGPNGQGGVAVQITGTTTIGQYLFLSPHTDRFPVVGGNYYEASAYVACYATIGNVFLSFYNSAGTLVGETASTLSVTSNHVNENMSSWPRPFVIVQAPPTAATARMHVKGALNDTSGNYYLTVSSCYFGEALASQTVPSPWTDGGISQITHANASTYIADVAIDTAQIALLAVKSAQIDDLAVDTLKIAGHAVTVPVGQNGDGSIPSSIVVLTQPGKIMVMVMANAIAAGSGVASLNLTATCAGSSGSTVGVSMGSGDSGSATAFGYFDLAAGSYSVGGTASITDGTRTIGATALFAIGCMK